MTVHEQFQTFASAPMTPSERLEGLIDAATRYNQLAARSQSIFEIWNATDVSSAGAKLIARM